MQFPNAIPDIDNFIQETTFIFTENAIISGKDLVLNFDKWKPGENNILYITGLSGSGKSTMAEGFEKKGNAKMFELDGVEFCYDSSNNGILEKAAEKCPKYKKIYDEVNSTHKRHKWIKDEYPILWEMWDKVISVMKEDSNNLYVVEGIQIWQNHEPEYYSGKPLIIKGTSFLVSEYRASKRDGITLKNFLKGLVKHIHVGNDLDKFRKSIKSIG